MPWEKPSWQPIDWRSTSLEVEAKGQRTDDGWFKLLNIEQQNDEVLTSIFEIPCSIFCGSKRRQLRLTEF